VSRMIKPILTYPNVVLETRCEAVWLDPLPPLLKETGKIVQNLLDTAIHHYSECLGLSANQLGYNARIFVMRTATGPFFHIINPEVVSRSPHVKGLNERCLSRVDGEGNLLPGVRIRRPKEILATGYILQDKRLVRSTPFSLKGIDARVFLHELDHLNGVVV
jgi:peptide deformylase